VTKTKRPAVVSRPPVLLVSANARLDERAAAID
jgi:hypothetical protein